jgi:hypothetical protein
MYRCMHRYEDVCRAVYVCMRHMRVCSVYDTSVSQIIVEREREREREIIL